MGTSARGNFQYFITFTGDFSRYGYVYLMRHKSESFEKFKEFQNELTPPGTPQCKGVSERRNQTLLDMVRSMMSHSDLPLSLLGIHSRNVRVYTK
ncbi:Retrovirus-related Pol polyprotein from transposon TNT 1-94 [Cardamine amara subsp. amara]|uniref:Retrovirus-related Pol polyprotein from transposon TNT 1-94 n=1 Tax=Cardamine amara subsp. amara TaxID=228776 RepID=A0ABD1AYT3_CARAN